MAVSAAGFHWMDSLEKQFDISLSDLDILLGGGMLDEMAECSGADEDGFEASIRQKLATLGSCWAQLCHKSQSVFQNHAKLEASLLMTRDDLVNAEAGRAAIEAENKQLLVQLHSVQLQLHRLNRDGTGTAAGSGSPTTPGATVSSAEAEDILKKLDGDLCQRRLDSTRGQQRLQAEVCLLRADVERLHRTVANLQAELVGHRLAAKYMDKELAGRIQQLQMLGRGIDTPEHERIWQQLDAEIRVHRHKTLIRACRSRHKHTEFTFRRSSVDSQIRRITVHKPEHEALGLSVTGGGEHAVPIVISSVKSDGVAARSGCVFVGDTILSVNGLDLREAKHEEAVQALSSARGDIQLQLLHVSTEADDHAEGIYDVDNLRYGICDVPDVVAKDGVVDAEMVRDCVTEQPPALPRHNGAPQALVPPAQAPQALVPPAQAPQAETSPAQTSPDTRLNLTTRRRSSSADPLPAEPVSDSDPGHSVSGPTDAESGLNGSCPTDQTLKQQGHSNTISAADAVTTASHNSRQ